MFDGLSLFLWFKSICLYQFNFSCAGLSLVCRFKFGFTGLCWVLLAKNEGFLVDFGDVDFSFFGWINFGLLVYVWVCWFKLGLVGLRLVCLG